MANINIDQLAAEIAKGLAGCSQDVVEKIDVSSERVGKELVSLNDYRTSIGLTIRLGHSGDKNIFQCETLGWASLE
jgi:hypothetical protein